MTGEGLEQLRRDEGCRLTAYRDAGGVWTIGYGHTGPEVRVGLTWTQALADAALALDVTHAQAGLRAALRWFEALDPVRQDVLTNIAFNVGVSALLRWTVTLGHFEAGRFDRAAADLLAEGKWNRDVGDRALRPASLPQAPGAPLIRVEDIAMWGLIAKGIGWLLGLLLKAPAAPSAEAVQAAEAAQSRTIAQADLTAARTEAAVAQAETDAPKTQAEVVDSLKKGTF